MPRSHRIADYFEIELEKLRPGIALPAAVHLYVAETDDIVVWKRAEDAPSETLLKKRAQGGMKRVWVHLEDRDLFTHYLKEEKLQARTAELNRTPIDIASLLRGSEASEHQKTEIVAKAAQDALSLYAVADENEERRGEEFLHAQRSARDALTHALMDADEETRALLMDLLATADLTPGLEHPLRVMTYSVLFCLGFGRIDHALLADVALAALLHDVGSTQSSATLAQKPFLRLTESERSHHALHPAKGRDLVLQHAPKLPARVAELISLHHERKESQDLKDDLGQILGIAERLDELASGLWDGKSRSFAQALDRLEKGEAMRPQNERFKPELVSAISRWVA